LLRASASNGSEQLSPSAVGKRQPLSWETFWGTTRQTRLAGITPRILATRKIPTKLTVARLCSSPNSTPGRLVVTVDQEVPGSSPGARPTKNLGFLGGALLTFSLTVSRCWNSIESTFVDGKVLSTDILTSSVVDGSSLRELLLSTMPRFTLG
jgi:hypothetical protein